MSANTSLTSVPSRRRIVVVLAALMVAAGLVVASPSPALAASKSCSNGQVRIYSNMTTGTWRMHGWVAGYTYSDEFAGLGWRYSYTGVSYVSDYYYAANGSVPSFGASCVGI